MAGISRAQIDFAGGLIASSLQVFVLVEGFPAAVVGSPVASHGGGPHSAATLVVGSLFVRINGLPVVRAGDVASCGHVATGSAVVSVDA